VSGATISNSVQLSFAHFTVRVACRRAAHTDPNYYLQQYAVGHAYITGPKRRCRALNLYDVTDSPLILPGIRIQVQDSRPASCIGRGKQRDKRYGETRIQLQISAMLITTSWWWHFRNGG
jgi:hypothetical protein